MPRHLILLLGFLEYEKLKNLPKELVNLMIDGKTFSRRVVTPHHPPVGRGLHLIILLMSHITGQFIWLTTRTLHYSDFDIPFVRDLVVVFNTLSHNIVGISSFLVLCKVMNSNLIYYSDMLSNLMRFSYLETHSFPVNFLKYSLIVCYDAAITFYRRGGATQSYASSRRRGKDDDDAADDMEDD